MALLPESVTFTMWRDGGGSATDYAVLSSVHGFTAGQQLGQGHEATSGSANMFEVVGSFPTIEPTIEPVEFRLYGWNATTPLDGTHLVGASMRGKFASVVGSQVDPTGELTVEGDYFHLAGSTLAIDLGGPIAGIDFDAVHVLGQAELEGNLNVSLASGSSAPFAPNIADSFEILTAAGGLSGSFSDISLPSLSEGLDWFIDYSGNSVSLRVVAAADFNIDGTVDSQDLVAWQGGFASPNPTKRNGDADHNGVVDGDDFLEWQRQVGLTAGQVNAAHSPVPEPLSLALLGIPAVLTCVVRKKDINCRSTPTRRTKVVEVS
jgi:hypothetical protein